MVFRKLSSQIAVALVILFIGFSFDAAMAATRPSIKITQFKITHPTKDQLCVKVHAVASDGAKIGSFFLRFADKFTSGQKVPPGFYKQKSYVFLASHDFGKLSPHNKDNGKLDENSEKGVWEVTINTSSWPQGRYLLMAGADNRPSSGGYIHDNRTFAVTIGNPPPLPPVSNIPGAKQVVIYQKPGVSATFPSLIVLGPEKFATSFGTSKGQVTMISDDGGYTWSRTNKKIINPKWKTSQGTLVRAHAIGWLPAPKAERAQLKGEGRYLQNVGGMSYLSPRAVYQVSKDNGKTWQTHSIKVPDYVSGLMNYNNASVLVTKEGLRLVAIYGYRRNKAHTAPIMHNDVFFLRSTDDGKTWKFVPMLPGKLVGLSVEVNETALIKTKSGDILAVMRSQSDQHTKVPGYLWQSVSHDNGLTWSIPRRTNMWGYPADLLQLQNGNLLCVYGYRRKPKGIRAAISSDQGETWNIGQNLILRQDGVGFLGYPLTAQLPDGAIFTIYFMQTPISGKPFIAGTHWKVPK